MPRRALLLAGAALGGALVLGYGASFALNGDDVPRGVRVAGTDVGGLSPARARTVLTDALAGPSSETVELVAAGERLTVDPARAGLSVDLDATLDEARSAGPVARLRGLFGTRRDVDPVAAVDRAALEGQLSLVAKAFDRPPREGAVRFRDSKPFAVLPQEGRTLDVTAAADSVEEQWLADGEVIEVAADTVGVKSTAEAVQRALTEVATPAVSGPVVVSIAGRTLTVTPTDIAVSLAIESDAAGVITPDLQAEKLIKAVDGRLAAVEQEPVDATFDVSSGTPKVIPGKDGRTVAPAALKTAVMGVLMEPAPRRTSLALTVTQPRVTTAAAARLGVKEVIGTFTTAHPCCRPRVTNIQRMADIVDGYVALPGETFSVNGFVGPRDRARGFLAAPQILEGQFVDAVGGGVSQFATTLYNATFFAGLEDVEHKPHSYYITRYPEGREATVSFPAPDLRWRNDSPHGVLVKTSYTPRSITVTLWGTKRYDEVIALSSGRSRVRDFGTEYVTRSDCTAASGHVGFDITITRVMKKGGKEVKRDSYTHRYLPEPRFICGSPPRRSSSSGSSPSGTASPRPSASPKPSAAPAAGA